METGDGEGFAASLPVVVHFDPQQRRQTRHLLAPFTCP